MKPRLGFVVGVLLVAGCGSNGVGEPRDRGPATTPRALAAVVADHVGEPDSVQAESNLGRVFTGHAVGAELRFGSDGEYDGDMLVVAVGSGIVPADRDCAGFADRVDGCVTLDDGVLAWEEVEPEEDPGVVHLVVPKGDATVLLTYAGPDISKDPRTLDLPISVADLRAIAADPRLGPATPVGSRY